MSCSISTTVMLLGSPRTMSATTLRSAGDSPAAGSSNMRTDGVAASAIASSS